MIQSARTAALLLLAAASGCTDDDAPQPALLTGLELIGSQSSLNPGFDPHVWRYSLIADDDPHDVAILPRASPGTFVTVDGRMVAPETPYSIAALSPGQTVWIEAHSRHGDSSTRYELLYLPHDFPLLTATLSGDEASADPLYVTLNGSVTSYLTIVDNHGVPLFYRSDDQSVFDFKWHAATGERSYLRHTGTANQWGRRNAEAVVLDSSFNEVERFTTVGLSHTDVHDFLITPHGEVILIAYEGTFRDLTYLGLSAREFVEESVIQVLNRATRQVLFQWNSAEHLPYEDQTYAAFRAEYAHVNSVVEDFDGNLIISASGLSQAVKIARPGGQIVWKLGGKTNQFHFLQDPAPYFCGQHTVSRLETGNLLVFDNGRNCWSENADGGVTRAVEYRLDERAMTAELVWSYGRADAFVTSQGSAQRLPNGNTLIGWGSGPGILATEVDSQGRRVFEMTAYDGDQAVVSYRAQRFAQ